MSRASLPTLRVRYLDGEYVCTLTRIPAGVLADMMSEREVVAALPDTDPSRHVRQVEMLMALAEAMVVDIDCVDSVRDLDIGELTAVVTAAQDFMVAATRAEASPAAGNDSP